MLTHRQWVILQYALLAIQNRQTELAEAFWDNDDGTPPTSEEIDDCANLIGELPHE